MDEDACDSDESFLDFTGYLVFPELKIWFLEMESGSNWWFETKILLEKTCFTPPTLVVSDDPENAPNPHSQLHWLTLLCNIFSKATLMPIVTTLNITQFELERKNGVKMYFSVCVI